jgi:SAM-dependent methyltransferase
MTHCPLRRPHDSWAQVYDLAFQEEFGKLYQSLTDATIASIETLVPAGARIVDFGAGTGRLSVPLAGMGYAVTAVEPSGPMLEVLRSRDTAQRVTCVEDDLQHFRAESGFDLALCLFTVVSYLLDAAALREALESASAALKPGGKMLIDIPSRQLFQGHSCATPRLQRKVLVRPCGENRYRYQEQLTVEQESGTQSFADEFDIRYWPADEVLQAAQECGFELQEDWSESFRMTGSSYFVLGKSMAWPMPGQG